MSRKKLFQCLKPKCQKNQRGRFFQETSATNPPVCPQCKLVGNDSTRFGHLVSRMVIIHFDPPSDMPGFGQGYRACDPRTPACAGSGKRGLPNPWHAVTGVMDEVNCPECRQSKEWLKARDECDNEGEGPSGSDERIREALLGTVS